MWTYLQINHVLFTRRYKGLFIFICTLACILVLHCTSQFLIFFFLLLVFILQLLAFCSLFLIYTFIKIVFLILSLFQCITISFQLLYPPSVFILTCSVFIKFTTKFSNYYSLWCQLVSKILVWNSFLINMILKLDPFSHVRSVFLLLDYQLKLFHYT